MSFNFRLPLALGAFFVATIALTACGDSVPGNSVARVDGETISRADFDHWFDIAASTSQPQGAAKVEYTPPAFTVCVANKRKTAPKPAKGQPQQTDAQFKAQCKQEYEGLRDQVMQFLILEKWISEEAADQGVEVTAKEADQKFEEAKKQAFPKEKDFQEFLKASGMTVNDAKFQVRFNTIYTKLREKAVKNATKVTDKAVADFYNKNKARFATPETRDLRVILTKDKAKAEQAKQALQSGQSWRAVAKRYSIDTASKNQGGSLLGIAKGTQEKAFDEAIFAAQKGKLTGPVKTQFGYYVFQVQKVVDAKQQSLKEAAPAIRQQLDAQSKQKADEEFNRALRKKWKARTNCAEEFVMAQCKNAPAPKTNTAPAGGVQTVPPQS
ncbi:MAG TPA: peptidyl-prolyl cis-trans isomerase [Solirubrobacteraceae bacterium]|nr:peptidyl-prolyl cis-trans isomerase [Solirubrobacteraceae bacterium]